VNERECGREAATRIYWPGRDPLLCCAEHAGKAFNVANAMGLYVHSEPVVSGGEPVTCTQIITAPELAGRDEK
jgi:hypothetical protein